MRLSIGGAAVIATGSCVRVEEGGMNSGVVCDIAMVTVATPSARQLPPGKSPAPSFPHSPDARFNLCEDVHGDTHTPPRISGIRF